MMYELVPSKDKEKGWENYQHEKEALLKSKLPTSDLLLSLHKIVTKHYDLKFPEDARESLETQLMVLDRPDGEQIKNACDHDLKAILDDTAYSNIPAEKITQLKQRLLRTLRQECEKNTTIKLDLSISGALRSYGTRRINNGPEETVYASHSCAFQSPASMLGFDLPPTYYGLSTGLPEVYNKLCDTYDKMMSDAKTIEDKILAEAFLQLWGTRVLHPFWDGNGRTFGLHLAYTLEKEGITLPYDYIKSLIENLTEVNDRFLKSVLSDANLSLVEGPGHFIIEVNSSARKEYMDKLRKSMLDGIERKLDPSDYRTASFYDAADIIGEHIATFEKKPYKKTSFPKAVLLERALATQPDKISLAYPAFSRNCGAIGILDKNGECMVRITLDDLPLNPAEEELLSYKDRLLSTRHELRPFLYSRPNGLCAVRDKLKEQHPRLSKIWEKTYDSFSARVLCKVLNLFPKTKKATKQYFEWDQMRADTMSIESKLKFGDGGADKIVDMILRARANGKTITQVDPAVLKDIEEIYQKALKMMDCIKQKGIQVSDS